MPCLARSCQIPSYLVLPRLVNSIFLPCLAESCHTTSRRATSHPAVPSLIVPCLVLPGYARPHLILPYHATPRITNPIQLFHRPFGCLRYSSRVHQRLALIPMPAPYPWPPARLLSHAIAYGVRHTGGRPDHHLPSCSLPWGPTLDGAPLPPQYRIGST